MSTQTVSPGEQPRQCITPDEARRFASASFAPTREGIERMRRIHEHCEACDPCAELVGAAVLGRAS